ncbi:MAG: ATP synthase F1 subunit epsilon [Solobacterium sp.]|nr:ATP synthase F1 subunit epsilon [Solobacterium sp.]MBR3343718.1 ATP synthase F1 subunit epsilon [Solobacterium sp.]
MIHCRIVTPKGVYKEMDASIINIVTTDGERGILPNHMPLVTMLKIGKMTAEESTGRQEYAVAGGLFYFRDNLAEILTDAVESKEEIDVERAESARQRAEKRLAANNPNLDIQRARIALEKALNRLSVSGRNL